MTLRIGGQGTTFFLALLIFAAPGCRAEGEILEQIYARVGDDIILKSEFEVQERMMIQQRRVNGEAVDGEAMLPVRRQLLQNMIDETLLLQQAEKLGIKATKKQIDEFVDSIRKQNNLTTEDDLRTALKAEGLTYEGLRKNLAKRIAIETVKQQEIYATIVTTDEELRAYYEAHKEENRQGERIRLGEIVLLFDPDKPQEETRKEAGRIHDLLVNGADFAEIATFVSQTPSREHGGDLGYIERGMLAPELEKVAYRLKPGEISEPVKTKFGYHILKLVGQKDERYRPFEEVKGEMLQALKGQKFEKAYKAYVSGLRSKTYLEVMAPGLAAPKDDGLS